MLFDTDADDPMDVTPDNRLVWTHEQVVAVHEYRQLRASVTGATPTHHRDFQRLHKKLNKGGQHRLEVTVNSLAAYLEHRWPEAETGQAGGDTADGAARTAAGTGRDKGQLPDRGRAEDKAPAELKS